MDGLILISSRMERQYRKKPKLLLPPLVDVEARVWQHERARKDDVFEFCYAGAPFGKDDLCLLVNAFAKLNRGDTRLAVMGVSREEFLREHPDYAPLLAARSDQIHFAGVIPHDQVIERLRNTDCFVMIRRDSLRNQAGFPTKFTEAFSSGTRIVTTDVSDIRCYPDQAVLIVPEMSAVAFAEAMEEAMAIPVESKGRDAFDYRRYSQPTDEFLQFFQKEVNNRKA